MPALGKSGTSRIFSFSISAVVISLPDSESGARAGHIVEHLDLVDARAARTVPDGALEPLHRVGLTIGRHFDAPVGQVADPPAHPFTSRDFLREVPEAHALNASADQIPPRDSHFSINPTAEAMPVSS